MPLARRRMMEMGLAAGTAGLLARADRPAVAAAPQAADQAPGFYRLMVGEIEITLVNDGAAVRPLAEGFVRNAPLAEVQGALAAAFPPRRSPSRSRPP
jgi:hypothetical protein